MLLPCVFLYSLLGSPTPDHPGIPELMIAICLLIAIGHQNLTALIELKTKQSPYMIAGKILLLYGIISGMVSAALYGHNLSAIIRDLIPFGFLLLPLLLHDLTKKPNSQHIFIFCAMIIGLGFSLRSLTDLPTIGAIATSSKGELLYLANMPTVLFSALFLIGTAGHTILKRLNLANTTKAAFYMGLALLPAITMALSLQRASIGGIFIATGIWIILCIIKTPYKAPRLLLPILLIILCTGPALMLYQDIIIAKSQSVGLNMRGEELFAVWNSISHSPLSILFGNGWGATFQSPAVSNIEVNFTHSLLSSMLLKTGVIGLALTLAYLWTLLQKGWPILYKNPVLALAILIPVLIDTFLYASFKSFDFGLILCLIPAAMACGKGQKDFE